MNLGESIKNIRQAKGLSQGEMQKRTGILRSYLSRVENGHTVPSLATLQRLASAMGVALSDFFSANGQPVEGASAAAAAVASDPASQYLAELKTLLPQLTSQQRDQLLDMVKDMAHALKGVCASIGAIRLMGLANNLMRMSRDELRRNGTKLRTEITETTQATTLGIQGVLDDLGDNDTGRSAASLHLN